MDKVSVAQKLAEIRETWSPKVVGELNSQHVKLAKLEGEYVWHAHENEDELFFVIAGRLRIELRDGAVELAPGEFFIVPRGVEHKPVALPAASVMLFEPASTVNTGNAPANQWTRQPNELERL